MSNQTIFKRLKKDHEKHRELLNRIETMTGESEERRTLFNNFRTEVTAHAAAEEETLYSTMLEDPELRHDGQHSVAEHHELDELMAELADMPMTDAAWTQKFKKLQHDYLHHIDEEEADMFPAAKEELSTSEAKELGEKFEERKPEEYARALEGKDMEDNRE
ncbi:hemerythrin domain-containing protein [Sphingomicrobium astaxanthinifaciens]|uniref:hemerythrin domain-containing protein n=1 Tax=Sphingomicrobium astaxanthinifaciens TaxID=1227949 RepID=UPI001FCA64BC|nr:hemerythrin domain-containing protein [Sphingomicrobium astaxanthinifaciens]MCJ7421519.1 hemerythrin domain-containing protein [Sphingomicrobium astaxanthinifaciens]